MDGPVRVRGCVSRALLIHERWFHAHCLCARILRRTARDLMSKICATTEAGLSFKSTELSSYHADPPGPDQNRLLR